MGGAIDTATRHHIYIYIYIYIYIFIRVCVYAYPQRLKIIIDSAAKSTLKCSVSNDPTKGCKELHSIYLGLNFKGLLYRGFGPYVRTMIAIATLGPKIEAFGSKYWDLVTSMLGSSDLQALFFKPLLKMSKTMFKSFLLLRCVASWVSCNSELFFWASMLALRGF